MGIIIRIVLLAVLIPTMSYGEDKHNHEGNEITVGVEALSSDLLDLLSQEMQALEKGMMAVIPLYNSGEWPDIETIGRKMKNSYILKQHLSEKQVEELHSVLPHAFIEKDQRFHYLSGMLEHAAKNKNEELINFYFSEMNESCFGCHSVFATHRFPALSSKEKEVEHSH